MLRAFFSALFDMFRSTLREWKLNRDYKALAAELDRRDAEAARQAVETATRERINREQAAMGDDPAVLRERMRARDPRIN